MTTRAALATLLVALGCSGKSAREADLALVSPPVPQEGEEEPGGSGESGGGTAGGRDRYDAGPPVTLDGGDQGGIPCVVGGVLETEPNDDASSASTLSPTVCGVVQPGDPSDWLTFILKNNSRSMFLGFDGNVTLTVHVDGRTFVVTPQTSPPVPFKKNTVYTVQVQAVDAQRQPWRVTLFES